MLHNAIATERMPMFKRQDDVEIESLSGELMRFDAQDMTVEELERRLEMTLASFQLLAAANCPQLQQCQSFANCTGNCPNFKIIVPPLIE
jgi:hypothetical protein